MDKMTEWKEEFAGLQQFLSEVKDSESTLKFRLKEQTKLMKHTKKILNQQTRERKKLQKACRTFWSKKKSLMRRHRKWAQDNPGKALERLGAADVR
jgi:septal ring factor EnvC (AmiA/AmiB activator)